MTEVRIEKSWREYERCTSLDQLQGSGIIVMRIRGGVTAARACYMPSRIYKGPFVSSSGLEGSVHAHGN